MTIITMEKLRAVLSQERLIPYGGGREDTNYIIKKYNGNVLLCEAMYPALHYFEVLLRNHINSTIGKIFNEDWLIDIPAALHLSTQDKAKINEIRDQVLREKKRPPTHPDIVSRLSFGFWCALFHRRFDPLLWHRKNAIRSVFPNLKRDNQTRKYVEKKLLRIKTIRNRIAHHERIWGGSEDTYQVYDAYKNCVDLISAMSEGGLYMLKEIDRFPGVYKKVIEKTLDE